MESSGLRIHTIGHFVHDPDEQIASDSSEVIWYRRRQARPELEWRAFVHLLVLEPRQPIPQRVDACRQRAVLAHQAATEAHPGRDSIRVCWPRRRRVSRPAGLQRLRILRRIDSQVRAQPRGVSDHGRLFCKRAGARRRHGFILAPTTNTSKTFAFGRGIIAPMIRDMNLIREILLHLADPGLKNFAGERSLPGRGSMY